MKLRSLGAALAVAVAMTVSACGGSSSSGSTLRTCTEYEDEVLDLDDAGECYAPDDDKSKTKGKKKPTTKAAPAPKKPAAPKAPAKSGKK